MTLPSCHYVSQHQSHNCIHPPSLLHLDSFKREAPREPLEDAQHFPLAYIHDNPTPLSPYSKVIFTEPVVMETISTEAPIWTCSTMSILHLSL